jgi:tetraacyldisaccharide 4'-kinase
VRQALQRAWLRRGALAWALFPLSVLYGALGGLHRFLFTSGLRQVQHLPVPVVVVGNVVAGGGGKTPVVLALLRHLQARGIRVGIVSRGYGRSSDECTEVHDDDDARHVGDEPLLLRRQGGVPVFVAARRGNAGRALLQAYPGTQVIVSDDGLQHHALARDIEVCVFDARGVGNGWLLPAGPLRERWPRPVDLVLRQDAAAEVGGHGIDRTLAATAVRADGTQCSLRELAARPVHALAGIASPDSFFAMLDAAGLQLAATHAFPDHHDFAELPPLPADAIVVCTEKDAVKLWRLRPDAWAVPLQVAIPAAFWSEFDRLLDARLSWPHGSPPA